MTARGNYVIRLSHSCSVVTIKLIVKLFASRRSTCFLIYHVIGIDSEKNVRNTKHDISEIVRYTHFGAINNY